MRRKRNDIPTLTFLLSGSGSLTIREPGRVSVTEFGRLKCVRLGEGGMRDATDPLRDGVMMWGKRVALSSV
jgi:hypothetical protein